MDEEFLLKIPRWYQNPVKDPEDYKKLGLNGHCDSCNFGYYYAIKSKHLLQHIPEISKSIFPVKTENEAKLEDYRESIWIRYEYILFNIDQIKEISKKYVDNDGQFLCENFTYNTIILTYSILDSLAWFINYWEKLELENNKHTITLDFSSLINNKFSTKLKEKNNELHEFLNTEENQKWVKYLKEFRDKIQHRNKVQTIISLNHPKTIVIEKWPILGDFPNPEDEEDLSKRFNQVKTQHGEPYQEINTWLEEQLKNLTNILTKTFEILIKKPPENI